MNFSTLGKFTAASLVAGAALGFAAVPADAAQTIPSGTAVVDIEANLVQAQYRGGRNYRGGHHYRSGRHAFRGHRGHRGRSVHRGAGIGFGLGFGLGLAVPYLMTPHYATPYAYAAPTPYASGLTPGTSAWIQYCSQKYNSFDPASGTYLAYSGVRRTCQVP